MYSLVTHCGSATGDGDDSPSDPRLNLVILFADNLGYDDVSCFQAGEVSGKTIRSTPNIDRLADEGMKFSNWNSAAALCSASRAALLTGKYPVRTGTYPGVFQNDASYGLLPEETTIAELLKVEGYATSLVWVSILWTSPYVAYLVNGLTLNLLYRICSGKWHLGHRDHFLPTNQGFDSWFGIPYHMSGGSIDGHLCNKDQEETMWLPLFANSTIVEQPVRLDDLASRYAASAVSFIKESVQRKNPFFLYMAFSHVHQLCAPRDFPEQLTCQWTEKSKSTFNDAVQEMDWIAGRIMDALDENGTTNNTLVIFTSDNGPWVAEQACAGSKGPFTGQWFEENADESCTACPHDYVPAPTESSPRRCILHGTEFELLGVPCGEDTGLGSVWEANLRMPALVRLPGRVPANMTTDAVVSTLDVLPTFLSMIQKPVPVGLDGLDMTDAWTGKNPTAREPRILFFWRDGFRDGPLRPPAGRFDVAAVKLDNLKAWFWTKSAHYNDDLETFHNPPLLFDTLKDPGESTPLNPSEYQAEIAHIKAAVQHHKEVVGWTYPLALDRDPANLPCVDRNTACRTHNSDQMLVK